MKDNISIVREGVSSFLLGKIEKVARKLNKKAHKLGLELGSCVTVNIDGVEWHGTPPEPSYKVTIIGPAAPFIRTGYKLLGYMQATDGLLKAGGKPRLINRVGSGTSDARLDKFRDLSKGVPCDCCKKVRPRKRMIIIEREESGEVLAVGKECAKEYIEAQDNVMAFFEKLYELAFLPDDSTYGGRGQLFFPLTWVIALTLHCIKTKGYTSKSKSSNAKLATAYWVSKFLFPPSLAKEREEWEKELRSLDETPLLEEAPLVIDWVKSQPLDSDYQYNVNSSYSLEVAGHLVVTLKTLGLVVSGVGNYARKKSMDQDAAPKQERPEPNNTHVGEIGQSLPSVLVRINSVVERESQYGTFFVVTVHVAEGEETGARLVWFSNRHPFIESGDLVKIESALVADHQQYKSRLETRLKRVKISAVLSS